MTIHATGSTPVFGSNPVNQHADIVTLTSAIADAYSVFKAFDTSTRTKRGAPSHAANAAGSLSSTSQRSQPGRNDMIVGLGDTLWNIAGNHEVPGATRYQKMTAIFTANPHAFVDNDMNRLKTGTRLSLPAAETVRAVDAARAERLCADQINAYEQKRHGTVSRALPPNKGAEQKLKPGDIVVVMFGQTLGAIAAKYQVADTTLAQRIVAIFNSNPDAFRENNMNHMKTGVRLVLPQTQNVQAVPADAAQRVMNEQWRAYKASRETAPARPHL